MPNKDVLGLLGTTVWFVIIAVVFLLIQMFVFGAYVGLTVAESGVLPEGEELDAFVEELASNGTVMAISTLLCGLICTALIFLAVKLNKGHTASDYLGLKRVKRNVFLKWMLIFIAVLVASELLTIVLGKDTIPEYMVLIYDSASPKWLLWVAVVIMAPIFEEVCFRGFLLEGLSRTVFKPYGAIVITAAIWAAIHVQYEFYYIAMIFIWGLIFGVCKLKTGSLYLPVAMHIMANFIAMAQFHF